MAAASPALGVASVDQVTDFGCDGSWAYVDLTTGTGSAASQQVIVLRSSFGPWVVANASRVCAAHEVPAAISTSACSWN